MNLFLVNTYLKVSLYILLTHTLLYILTLQKLAMLVQRSGSRKGSTAMCSDLMNINQPLIFMNNNEPPNLKHLPTLLLEMWLRMKIHAC